MSLFGNEKEFKRVSKLEKYVMEAMDCDTVGKEYCNYKRTYGPDTAVHAALILTYLVTNYPE